MTEEELQLKNLVYDCEQNFCPLYSAFWNKDNAQSEYRRNQFKWAHKYYPQKFKIGEEVFGAKLAIIMESPPPKYLEYFYGPQGKGKKLFSNVMRTLIEIEGLENERLTDKDSALKWLAKKGLMIIDAAKCRMKITPQSILSNEEPKTEKISDSEIEESFNHCSDLLKLQLKIINPFKVGIGIASVYGYPNETNPYILGILQELGNERSFIPERTVSIFTRNREHEFINWLKKYWLIIKSELSNFKIEYA